MCKSHKANKWVWPATTFIINAHLILPHIYYIIFGASKWVEPKNLFDNDGHMGPIIYLIKFGYQGYVPNLEVHNHGKMYYNLDGTDNFTRQGHYEYGATLFVTFMICVYLCFPVHSTIINQWLWSMESKSTTHKTQTTLKKICKCNRRRIIYIFISFSLIKVVVYLQITHYTHSFSPGGSTMASGSIHCRKTCWTRSECTQLRSISWWGCRRSRPSSSIGLSFLSARRAGD